VTAEGDGIKGQNEWFPDRPDLTFESLADLFSNLTYRIPATAGALKHFAEALRQIEDYPGGKRTPKDILSALRLAEYGCLGVMDHHTAGQKRQTNQQRQKAMDDLKMPPYLRRSHDRKVRQEHAARIWAPDGVLGRRLPRIRDTEQETA
jgi:hypothetical protein